MTITVTSADLIKTATAAAKKAVKGRASFISTEDVIQAAILSALENPRSTAPFMDAYRAAQDYIARNYDHQLSVSRDMRMGFAKTQELVREAVANGMTQNEALAACAADKNDHAGVTAETYIRLDRKFVVPKDEPEDEDDKGHVPLPGDHRPVDETASGALDAKRAIAEAFADGSDTEQRVLNLMLAHVHTTVEATLPSLRTIASELGITKHAAETAVKNIRARMEWAR